MDGGVVWRWGLDPKFWGCGGGPKKKKKKKKKKRRICFGLGGFHGFFYNNAGILSSVIPPDLHVLSVGVLSIA